MTENAPNKVPTKSIKIPEDLHLLVKLEAANRRISIEALVTRILEEFMTLAQKGQSGDSNSLNSADLKNSLCVRSQTPENPDRIPAYEPQEVGMLRAILESKKPGLISAIRQNLLQFAEFAGMWNAERHAKDEAHQDAPEPGAEASDPGGPNDQNAAIAALEQTAVGTQRAVEGLREDNAKLFAELESLRQALRGDPPRKRKPVKKNG